MSLQKLFDDGFEAVKGYVDRSFAEYDSRIEAMEKLIGKLIEKPDPVSVKSALIDRNGSLVLTLSNGDVKDLGIVIGKDGNDGAPGVDGLGFDDLELEYDGEKTAVIKFTRGDQVKEFTLIMPVVLDRGIFKEGTAYQAGDGVTWAGSFWIAQEDTTEMPDNAKTWRLAVKKGRDGRDGRDLTERALSPVKIAGAK